MKKGTEKCKFSHVSIFSYYQSLLKNRTHIWNILATFFYILEIKVTDDDSDKSKTV